MSENNTETPTMLSPTPFDMVLDKLKNFKDGFMSFEGRARRGEYWTTILIVGVPMLCINLVMLFIGAASLNFALFSVLSIIAALSGLLLFPLSVRRWHDFGLPAWVPLGIAGVDLLSSLGVPFLGQLTTIAWLVFMCLPGYMLPGGKGTNVYGADPLNPADKTPPTKSENKMILWIAIALLTLVPLIVDIVSTYRSQNDLGARLRRAAERIQTFDFDL